ncbi:hypothetical protein WICMUC_000904 [Wickerhamomyces mucosus]|uniref:NADH:flavin oxidoreductase/NADH oxidase N-terminal domain-containing protein n=1 Tax=Wickerhamomyces mucosus TaxID=1378264 RepID=A0A9P8PWE1_9ASCO|nr:hypothetical protein WICMUC_000904 [Wickerhamomyces mucosus]
MTHRDSPVLDERYNLSPLKGTNLFKPLTLSDHIQLNHRLVYSPLTRFRSNPKDYCPTDLQVEHYDQRSKRPGSIIITEGTYISEKASGFPAGVPGIWSDDQIESWSKVFKKIRENGSYSIVQTFHMGRQALPGVLSSHGLKYKAPSPIYAPILGADDDAEVEAKKYNNELTALTLEEVEETIQDFLTAGKNAIKAGADAIQVHVANGYLLNQFLDPSANQRTDKWGGSIEKRSALPLRIIDDLIKEIGASKITVRIRPFGTAGNMAGNSHHLILAQYAHFIGELEKRALEGNRLLFLDIVEPLDTDDYDGGSNEFVYSIWKGFVVRAGDYIANEQRLREHVSNPKTLISIGRHYISNPDLPDRLENGWKLTKYDRSTFYTNGAEGYIDYPRYENIAK